MTGGQTHMNALLKELVQEGGTQHTSCCFCRLLWFAPDAVASLPSCLICDCAAASSFACCALLASSAAYACTVQHTCIKCFLDHKP